jgi:disulfide bond formation protein DsbB
MTVKALAPPTSASLDRAAWLRLFGAWLIALLATAGALFLGEVMGMTPCVLCWYQRIAMFPLVLVLGIGLLDSDPRSVRFALPLAVAGWSIALYHCLVFWGLVSEALSPCSKGASCADADVQVAGFVPIPLLSLIAFTAIVLMLPPASRRVNP